MIYDYSNLINLYYKKYETSKIIQIESKLKIWIKIFITSRLLLQMVGWKPKRLARRIVLLASDALPKIAGDGQVINKFTF